MIRGRGPLSRVPLATMRFPQGYLLRSKEDVAVAPSPAAGCLSRPAPGQRGYVVAIPTAVT